MNPSTESASEDAAPLFAVVDLGTNTFHLLVASFEKGKLVIAHRERHFVRVAGDGISTIGAAPYARAIAAAKQIGASLRQYQVQASAAFGTAALRTASNGPELKADLSEALGVSVQVIDGAREARLIARGVEAAGLKAEGTKLIMDIGGGSTEFILTSLGSIKYAESFPLGAQVLRQRFHTVEPFGKTQHDALVSYLDQSLIGIREAVTRPVILVGASGTFDVLGDLYGREISPALRIITAAEVRSFYNEALSMTEEQRLNDPRIPADRADMIVVALALIVWVLDRLDVQEMFTCTYALKEGALLELQLKQGAS